MEETLGKRIAACRKRLGITQDRLAEQLGVTAQAVSKWENDQSCPDITMLPKLAEIFGTSTDALLGIVPTEPREVVEAEVVTEEPEEESGHKWELRWDTGRKNSIGLAVWIILTAGWMFAAAYYGIDADFWDLLWTNGLIVFGVFGLFPRFSFFHLGCALFGAHSLLKELDALPGYLGKDLLLPAFLLLLGLSLLVDAVRKPRRPHFSVVRSGKSFTGTSAGCHIDRESFRISCSFSEKKQVIALPRLCRGDADVSFGSLTLDLTAVESFGPECFLDVDCSFGELTILVPRHVRAEVDQDASFGSVSIRGDHDSETSATVFIDADASFGQILVRYI